MTESIRDVMTGDVESVQPDTMIKEAAQLMKSMDFGSVPVCEERRVVGVITDRDITVRAVAEGKDPASTPVSDVMSKDVVSIREDADLKEAERLMQEKQLRRLPVLNAQGDLVGYLPIGKVARKESPEQAGKVLQSVSEPRKQTGKRRGKAGEAGRTG